VPPLEDGSLVVGAGAALVWVGAVAARLSIDVPIVPWPPVDDDVPPDDAEADTEWGVGDERPDTDEPPPEWDGPDVLGVSDEPPESAAPCDAALGDGSSKSDSVGPECEGVGPGVPVSDPDPDPESDPASEPGPEPRSTPPTPLPPVSADIPPPMFEPTSWPERVDVEESDSDESEPLECELEPEPESELESELDEDESLEELEDESEEDESEEDESESPSPSDELEPPSPSPPSDDPPCPSIRLSTAWWARCPAFSPRLSRTPSARVCGVCLMASQPALAPCLTVVARS
jgi:hypothetical protein